MNIKRITFWGVFIIILGLIIWGLVLAEKKTPKVGKLSSAIPAEVTSIDHVRGPVNAPVTLIEYSDFQCPACASYFPIIEKLSMEASTTLRFVYRHYPLYPQPHKNAFIAAQASEAADLQGKFWEMYNLLFENQSDWAESNSAETFFEGYAKSLNLNIEQYKADFASGATEEKVKKDKAEGVSLGINSTPTFFLNGKAITNPNNYEQFKVLIDAAAQDSTK